MLTEQTLSVALPMIVGGCGLFLTFYLLQKKRPRNLECVGRVKELYLHPVKSSRGCTVREAECTWLGLKCNGVFDRHYLIYDPSNQNGWVGLKEKSKVAFITSDVEGVGRDLTIFGPDVEPLTLGKSCKPDAAKAVQVKLFGEGIDLMDCGDEAASWVNKALGTRGLRLAYSAGCMEKKVESSFFSAGGGISADKDENFNPQFLLPEQSTYNLLSQASVDGLNERLQDQKISVRNFRPNIVVEGCNAHDEDDWEEIFINNARFFQFSLCDRCAITTVDPDNPAQAHVKKEPLVTLRDYRLVPGYGNSPCFGIKLGISHLGSIKVGDKIYARKKAH